MVNGRCKETKCKYCPKIMRGGGKFRLKQHLAGKRGDVTPCKKVPKEVRAEMQKLLGLTVSEISKIRRDTLDPLCLGDSVEDPGVLKGKGVSRIDDSTDDRGSVDMRGMDEKERRKHLWITEILKFTSQPT